MSERHESLDKSKEEVSGEVKTLQDCKAATVNVKENSLYICRAFYLSVPVEGVNRERSWIQQKAGGTTSAGFGIAVKGFYGA